MNDESSRSHLIIGVVVSATNLQTQSVTAGKLSFVDLAGSERVKKSGSVGDGLKEAQAINKSLSALGALAFGFGCVVGVEVCAGRGRGEAARVRAKRLPRQHTHCTHSTRPTHPPPQPPPRPHQAT